MKYLLITVGMLLILSACQSNQTAFELENPALKAENFQNGTAESPGVNYAASEADSPEYHPRYLEKAIEIAFSNRHNHWLTGAKALDSLMDEILAEQGGTPDISSRVDLQIISYINFDQFILKADPSELELQKAMAAKNLNRLFEHSKPIEWKRLASSLLMAKSSLSPRNFESIKTYIVKGANLTLEDPDKVITDPKVLERLRGEALAALEMIKEN